MACTNVFDAFRYATEDLDQQIYKSAQYRSIWLNLIPRGVYPRGVGTYRSVFAVGDMEYDNYDTYTWAQIDLSNKLGASGDSYDTPTEVCTPAWDDVAWGHDELQYGPEMNQLRGPVVCRKDLLFSHEADAFLASYIAKATIRARRQWERRYEDHHITLSRKAICIPDFESAFYDQATLESMTCAECELSQEMLEYVAQRLIEDGATNPDGNGFITLQDAGPVFSLHIGMNQSQRLLRQNADLREDYRFADPNTLIARIGASRVIGNFRHIINQRPRRYTCAQGTYTEVLPHVTASGTKGSKSIINPLWRSAPYEGADVLCPDLYTSEIVQPSRGVAGAEFNPVSYMGEWQFVTGSYKWDTNSCDSNDPLEDRGRHFAEFVHAPKPNPVARYRWGYHIIFKRCLGNVMECTTCSS